MHADVHVHEKYADWVITMWLIKRSELVFQFWILISGEDHKRTVRSNEDNFFNLSGTLYKCAEWLRQLPDYEKEPKVNIQETESSFIHRFSQKYLNLV